MTTEPERLWFDEHSWVDITRGFVPDAGDAYRELVDRVSWQQGRVWRYEKWMDEPRLGSYFSREAIPHPVVAETQQAIERRYGIRYEGVALAWYRDQRDSVAFHRDREMRYLDDTVVGILTLGAKRPFLVGPRGRKDKFLADNGGATHDLAPGTGDPWCSVAGSRRTGNMRSRRCGARSAAGSPRSGDGRRVAAVRSKARTTARHASSRAPAHADPDAPTRRPPSPR
jgi:hypothetical protein